MPSEEWSINHLFLPRLGLYQTFRNLSNAHWQLMYFRCKPRFTDLNANDVLTRHFLLISIAFFFFSPSLHILRSINLPWILKWREQRAVETFDMSRNRRGKSQDTLNPTRSIHFNIHSSPSTAAKTFSSSSLRSQDLSSCLSTFIRNLFSTAHRTVHKQ